MACRNRGEEAADRDASKNRSGATGVVQVQVRYDDAIERLDAAAAQEGQNDTLTCVGIPASSVAGVVEPRLVPRFQHDR